MRSISEFEGRIVGHPMLQPLHREVETDVQELCDRIFSLFVMAWPRLGGGEGRKRDRGWTVVFSRRNLGESPRSDQ
jgi:hypothetical protein